MRFFSAHWVAMAVLALAIYIGLPLAAPILANAGRQRAANVIYTIFRPLCHQLPERSYFLYGEQSTYTYDELAIELDGFIPQRYEGGGDLGYKVAICERCVAIFGVMLIASVAFGLLRSIAKPLSLAQFGLFIVPLAIDGTGQLLGFWTSSWMSRTITGSLFGIAIVWLAFPYIERGMREIHAETSKVIASWRE